MYYSLMGTFVTVFVGVIVSYITGKNINDLNYIQINWNVYIFNDKWILLKNIINTINLYYTFIYNLIQSKYLNSFILINACLIIIFFSCSLNNWTIPETNKDLYYKTKTGNDLYL